MTVPIEDIWKKWAVLNLCQGEKAPFRKGSCLKNAAPWVEGRSQPALPAKMLSTVEVYNAWLNSHNLAMAQAVVKESPHITFRGLTAEILRRMDNGETSIPYIWWVWVGGAQKRVLYEDLLGTTFIKLNGKWEMACSIKSAGALAGAQGIFDFEALPPNCYFLPWESEKIARSYLDWS